MFDPISSDDLADLLLQRSELINRSGTTEVVTVESATGAQAPSDATIKLIHTSVDGKPIFVTVSGDGNPDLVARATRNIQDVRGQLSERWAEPVVKPLETGMVQGRSFAVWPMLSEFPERRVPRYLAKRRIRPEVFYWLSAVLAETHIHTTAADRQVISANLAILLEDRRHPDHLRRAADISANRLATGSWVPVHCVQHSDLWMGNIMVAPTGSLTSFSLIDWAGATIRGYPFFDLCRFAISSNAPSRLVKKHVISQLGQLNADSVDVTSYVLCALGQMQSHLEFFPEKLFREMALETTDFCQKFRE
jgi:hypothetical protein